MTPAEERQVLFLKFHEMKDKNVKDGLISIKPISRRRPHPNKEIRKPYASSFSYKIRCGIFEKTLCLKAFTTILLITLPGIRIFLQSSYTSDNWPCPGR